MDQSGEKIVCSKTNEKIEIETNKTCSKPTFKDKFKRIIDNITVEPILMGYSISNSLVKLATQNLNLDKACRVNLNYSNVVCDALIAREENKYIEEELAVQKLVSAMEVWKMILQSGIPGILIIFLGAWSDRTGKRKICILMPIFGDFLMCLSNALNTYFFYELPVQVTMFMEAIFPAMTGAWMAIYMAIYSYVAEISTKESRTFRMGMVSLCTTAGVPMGSALSGILLKSFGYYGVFGIGATVFLLCFVYGLLYIEDIKKNNPDIIEKRSPNMCLLIKSFFNINHVKDTLMVVFKTGPDKRRCKAILVFVAIAFINGTLYGEAILRYLFTRYKFNWDALNYSFFLTYYVIMHGLGAIFSITLFSKYLKWDDAVLGIISSLSHVLSAICFGLARNGSEFYIATIVEMMNATSFTALRSISSKLVASEELGKMTSLFNLMETVSAMVFGSFYSWLYMLILKINVSILYYLSAVLTTPATFIFIWFFLQHIETKENKNSEDIEQSKQEILHDNQKPLLNHSEIVNT